MGEVKKFRRTLSATSLIGDEVVDQAGTKVGKIEELMIDVVSGRVAYAVLSFGGFLGMGNKLFALPWSSVAIDEVNKRFVTTVDRQTLERAPGFDKDTWPDMSDPIYAAGIYKHYGAQPYWE